MIELKVQMPPVQALLDLPPHLQRDVNEQAAIGVRNLMRRHFDNLPGATFWGDASRKTRVEDDGKAFSVVVRQRGVALQRFGGTVTPGKSISTKTREPTKLLAVPTKGIAEAPNAYGPLVFQPVKGGKVRGILLPGEVRPAKRAYKGQPAGRMITAPIAGADPYFLLCTQTEHDPHPEVLPTGDEMAATAAEYAGDELRRILSQQ